MNNQEKSKQSFYVILGLLVIALISLSAIIGYLVAQNNLLNDSLQVSNTPASKSHRVIPNKESQPIVVNSTDDFSSFLKKSGFIVYGKVKTPIDGLTQFSTNKGALYFDPKTDTLIYGVMLDLKSGKNITETGYTRLLSRFNHSTNESSESLSERESPAYQQSVSNVLSDSSYGVQPSQKRLSNVTEVKPQVEPVSAVSSTSGQVSKKLIITTLKNEKQKLLEVMSKVQATQSKLKRLELQNAPPKDLALEKAELEILKKSYLKQYYKLLFASIPDKFAITFPAIGNQRGIINVMGHADCPHCDNFVSKYTKKLQSLGFKVRYFFAPWPSYTKRNGEPYVTPEAFKVVSQSESANQMAQVYCSKNKREAFMSLVLQGSVPGNPQVTNTCKQLENGIIDFNYVEHHIVETPIIVDSLGNLTKGTPQDYIGTIKKLYGIK